MDCALHDAADGRPIPAHRARWVALVLSALGLTLFFAPLGTAQEVSRQFRPYVRVEGEYNDNFFLTQRDTRDELREIVTPGFSLRMLRGQSWAEIAYAPSLVHSSLNEGEVEVFHLLNGTGSLALSDRVTLRATENFLRTDVPALADPRGIRRDRITLIQNTLTADLAYTRDTWSLIPRYSLTLNRTEAADASAGDDPGRGTDEESIIHTLGADGTLDILRRNTLGLGYDLTVGEFTAANDFVGHTVRASFSRQLNPVTTASVRGSLSHRDVRSGDDFNIVSGDVGLSRAASRVYSVEGRVGYNLTDVTTGEGAQGVFFLLQGTYTGRLIRFTGASSQSLQETFLEADNVGVTETRDSTLQVQYDLSERLTLTLRGRLAENRLLQSRVVEAGQPRTRDDLLLDLGVEISFRLGRLFLLVVSYGRTSVDSNAPGFDYQNNRVRVGLTATYE